MLRAVLISSCLFLSACAATEAQTDHQNQPHLPPPDFSESEDPRYCGVRMVGGGENVCPPGEFCRREIKDMCGAADAPGICSPIPEACTMDYTPVCGCDGQTYSNECMANSKSVSAAYKGECKP